MSVRNALENSHRNLTASEASVRSKQEARAFELGYPLCPQQYAYNNRPLWVIWRRYGKWLYKKRLLAYSDGPALLELCEAELNQQADRKQAALCAWKGRPQFPEPVIPGNTLAEFIRQVATCRASFSSRLIPTETLMLDADGGHYEPEPGDATQVARQYALDSLTSADTGEDIKQACTRWLKDLDDGHQRGIFWDPVEARLVVRFAREFCKLDTIMPWQVWVLTSIFAFKRATGLRRFSEVWLSMARKNGKTKFASTLGLFMLVADQEKYAEVYAASTAKEQSRICWKDARRSVGDNIELSSTIKRWAGELAVPDTDSKFCPLASEEKSFLGVRASGIIADEVGVWASRDTWDVLVQSTVSRTQPLTLAITTAPAHRMTFAHEKFSWAEKILRGIVECDHVFAAIFRIDKDDSPKNIVALRKANPSLGVTLREEHLVRQIAELEDMPSGLNNFLQFHANITPERTLMRQGSIPPKKWDACAGLDLIGERDPMKAMTKFLSLNMDTPCYCGIDIGMSNDLTAVALFFPKARFAEGAESVDRKVVVVQCFAPEIGITDKERLWGAPLSVWAREGYLQLLPGDLTDLREIKKFIIEQHQRFHIIEAGFDPWSFPTEAAELNEMGITCVSVAQVPSQLTAPCQQLLSAVHTGELVHFGSPILAWMAGNVILVESEKHSGLKPEKLNPTEKIDGISAIITAWHRFLSNPPPGPFRCVYLSNDGSGTAEELGPDGNLHKMKPLEPQKSVEQKPSIDRQW